MGNHAIEQGLRWAVAGGWRRLALVCSGLWAGLVVLFGLASSDPGQNQLARLLVVPIAGLWCIAYAADRLRRGAPWPADLSALMPWSGDATVNAEALRLKPPEWWWAAASVLVFAAAVIAAFALQSGPQGIVRPLVRLLLGTGIVAAVAAIAYKGFPPRTAIGRAKFLAGTAFAAAALILFQAFDDTQRVPLRSSAREASVMPGAALGDRTGRKEKAAQASASAIARWSALVAEAMTRHNEAYLALASQWEADTAPLRFESMLTPATLASPAGRAQNRESLARFEALLADYMARLEPLQRDYRADVLAIEIPRAERERFLAEFEPAFAASAAETKALNADFERVELDIARTIRAVTDLIEDEENVTVGPDGTSLWFDRDAAADDYNALLKALERITAEEAAVLAKSRATSRRRLDSLKSASSDLR